MRYLFLILVSLLPALLGQQVIAAPSSQKPIVARQSSFKLAQTNDFWQQSREIVQQQINLIERIERAIAGPDLNRALATRSQLTFHQGIVEDFLRSQYSNPAVLCSPSGANRSDLSVEQKQVYCYLYASIGQLQPLRSLLEARSVTLGDLAGVDPIVPDDGRLDYSKPITPPWANAPNLPAPEPGVIGKPAKKLLANYDPPIQPAIAPPVQGTVAIQAARQLLARAIAAFPPTFRFTDPTETVKEVERLTYNAYPLEAEFYAKFLAVPNTGISLILPAEAYNPDPNKLRNRLAPTLAQRNPYTLLHQRQNKLSPRLAVRSEKGNFRLAQPGLDYGFMVDVGDVPLEKLDSTLKQARRLSPQMRQLFLTYSPPNRIKALQEHGRSFYSGSLANYPPNQLGYSQAPAVLNHTYVVRLVQFKLPEVLLNLQPVARRDRRKIDELIQTSSSDVLVAFRPVHRRTDGTYTILWRFLGEFPDPQVKDIEDYLNLD
ncbi:hypothetical protein H6F77_03430 [Microcoleus sp. FACHB-831]|uniref:hypothetical protein n=1 Tax=Microcoleus sp. FACHB-831 TaxID=2692827 RepID=UPI0016851C09|nr:hypothetical protein [Microcoleus sp. FACHB-831]MBD1920166.1 hypothetical protein [Microcoleus sp. FACHB-831]